MEVKKGYKQTSVLEEWVEKTWGSISILQYGASLRNTVGAEGTYRVFGTNGPIGWHAEPLCDRAGVIVGRKGIYRGIHYSDKPFFVIDTAFYLEPKVNLDLRWAYYCLLTYDINRLDSGSAIPSTTRETFYGLSVRVPPLPEQRAIAEALSDVDTLLVKQEQMLAKKRDIKQGMMQELLTGKRRLPGFSGDWVVKSLEETTVCLDNLRVPLNDAQRAEMQGDYPYCGANGVVGFVNDYVIDDDFILIAEDGGYFDEYAYRPIAYKMSGKCWVNNHAHILKAQSGYCQDFIFYCLVHKNILPFLASGTRAKLNKSEMYKIQIDLPIDESEQTAIAAVLSDMDTEIAALEQQRDKTKGLKQGMMQELLTGRIRLV